MGKLKVTVIVFAWNEIDGMRVIMPQMKKEWFDELIIVDGGSIDGSVAYAKEHGWDVFVQKESGAGAAFREALERSTGDIIIPFSPDGNSIPEMIPALVAKINEGYDFVTASRYAKGAKSYDDDPVTAFGNWMFTTMVNVLYGQKLTDVLVMYRAYRRDLLTEIGGVTNEVSWGSQLLLKTVKKGKRITEIPGDEPARIGGVRKMSPLKNGWAELCMILKERFSA
ncbi:MAG: glycosyltransferase family 2 protein [Candidatus Omnitrophota bacterium]